MTLAVVGVMAFSTKAAEVDRLKSDLVGLCMGGREKCWRFQSLDQIKELTIKRKDEVLQKRTYTVALKLQAGKDSARYAAEARVEYVRTADSWKIQHVGLLSLSRIQ